MNNFGFMKKKQASPVTRIFNETKGSCAVCGGGGFVRDDRAGLVEEIIFSYKRLNAAEMKDVMDTLRHINYENYTIREEIPDHVHKRFYD
jgi:hypothetical protein